MSITRRSAHDREIIRLALPAFGALAAEPLYILADTAIVGHLGTRQLSGLALAGAVLTAGFQLFNFLAYATTGAVARHVGAGNPRDGAEQGIEGVWLAVLLGVALTVVGLVFAPAIVDAMGASKHVHPYAVTYLRISILGAPAMLITLAAAGFLRGWQDTRTTLYVAVGQNVLNLVLELALVYGLHLGVAGSAWGTVVAQLVAAIAYLAVLAHIARHERASFRPHADGMRASARVGGKLVVRTASLLIAFLVTTAIASRLGDAQLAAHQIAFQVMMFLALSMDALAIAGQALVGKFLGASDAVESRAASRRLLEWGVATGAVFAVGLTLVRPWLPAVFTGDEHVRALASQVLWVVIALQPVNAVVFVLDGILIGAGDLGYLAVAMAFSTFVCFLPVALLVLAVHGTLLELWGALCVLMLARLATMWARYRTGRWQVLGAELPARAEIVEPF
ncbi:MAG TPA: MATE family efflux transporter [Acidimicrobiia bacterium]